MAVSVRWAADRRREASRPWGWPRRALTSLADLAVVLGITLAVVGIVALRGLPDPDPRTLLGLTAGAQDATPEELTAVAADALDDATAPGGTGYSFEIIQTSTMVARPGGPKIPVPKTFGRGTAELADRYFLHTIIERGVVRPDGFWSQMRAGPAEGGKPDWDGSQIMFEALVRDGERWRDDGGGWYQAAALPGIGLDPETATLLPTLVRDAGAKADDLAPDDPKGDPAAARNLEAAAAPADIPGIIAADGLDFTVLRDKLAYGFDDAGRLTSITVSARNTHMTEFDLVIDTVIVIAYDAVDALPEPTPVWDGEVE